MSTYAELSARLTESLSLKLPPIAVSITDEVPAGVPAFEGAVPAGCVFWEKAAAGAFATSTPDHELCAIGVHTHHMAGASAQCASELGDVLKVLGDMTYVREEDIPQIPVLEREARHVVYAPLPDAPLAPDLVLVFAHAQQGLIVSEAVQQLEGGAPPALGRPACSIVPQAINTGRAALSLGCCGARAYLDALTDDVALWALPGAELTAYVERIEALSNANAVLAAFHTRRRRDVEAGERPTVKESLTRFQQ